jgi:hypothetical protein
MDILDEDGLYLNRLLFVLLAVGDLDVGDLPIPDRRGIIYTLSFLALFNSL